MSVRYVWHIPRGQRSDLEKKPCICCGNTDHGMIRSFKDENYYIRRAFGCPVVSGTDPDPFYAGAGTEFYLALTLNPRAFAELYHYNKESIDEFFKLDNKLIVHPVRVKTFRDQVVGLCDAMRESWEFKREVRWESDSEDELTSDDDSQL